ncbi:MAG: twin-arginine translocase TatA/TatE family subunit [Schwartzia succinivorans]|jgi:sec-independent protein translocase protein TatA|nr:twin-arginine translocase TatA/TatE family subunit [Schwartzia succinivorans]
MFGLGVPELLLILVIGLVIFGPGKLSESGKALGKSIREFRAAASEKEEPKKIGGSREETKSEKEP